MTGWIRSSPGRPTMTESIPALRMACSASSSCAMYARNRCGSTAGGVGPTAPVKDSSVKDSSWGIATPPPTLPCGGRPKPAATAVPAGGTRSHGEVLSSERSRSSASTRSVFDRSPMILRSGGGNFRTSVGTAMISSLRAWAGFSLRSMSSTRY